MANGEFRSPFDFVTWFVDESLILPPPVRAMKNVFISYSHKDEVWKNRLLPHLHALEQAGVEMKVWHDRKIDGGDKWYPEIQEAMDNAAVAVLLISADFLSSDFCVKEEVPYLIQRQEKHGMLLIPVLVRKCPWKAHRWLADRQMIPRDGKCVAIDFPDDHADGVFSDVAESIYFHFAKLSAHPQTGAAIPPAVQKLARTETAKIAVKASEPPVVEPHWPLLPSECVDLNHLPQTDATLFGREEELAFLDKLWTSIGSGAAAAARVLAFRAQGGVGKSALINRWLAEMKRDNFRGASRVFGWSFYSQGVREQGAASADSFLAAALKFFGDEAMAGSSASAWDKGARLAHLIGQQHALLILDGMEPLQSANWVDRGKLLDPGLESLLRGLARQSGGLCIITTREPLAELGKKSGVIEHDLNQISQQAGRALLRASHIVGTDAELQDLATRFGPHALAISLLAVYLHEQPGHGIGPADALEKLPGNEPVDRVLAGFEKLLANSAELEALRLLGFFDRPADEGCLRALRDKPAIAGLTELVAGMEDADWHRVLAQLDKLHLVHARLAGSGKRFVDTHPLIREHFARQLREKNPEAWRAGHKRLYEHLCKTTSDKKLEPTLEDLQPLYQAVAHGCQAGLQQEACANVYRGRILRGNENFSTYKLGALGSDLGAIACLFNQPWSRASPALTEPYQAWLLNEAAFSLRALGRLTEALELQRANVKMRVKQENWMNAAIGVRELSMLDSSLGDVKSAVRDAEQAVAYADRSGDAFERMGERCVYADALHQAGRLAEAETRFREAEQMQAEDQPDDPLLYSVQGFQYCDLLLAAPERAAWQAILNSSHVTHHSSLTNSCRAVSQRTAQTIKIEERNNWILAIALDHLTLGCATLYRAILENSDFRLLTADLSHVDAAVAGLRRASDATHLPRGLLTRVWLRFLTGARTGPESAQEDLDEAWEIAERGPMKLFLTDIHLHRARLFGRLKAEGEMLKYPWESPAADLAAAEKLINDCGYHRRDEELADAKKAILGL
jgi:tetratricopeptide (TPR) repeat protein